MSLVHKLMLVLSLCSREPSYEQLVAAQPLKGQVIVVDPGHGGQDKGCNCHTGNSYTGGAFGAYTGQSEGDVNLRVSNYLKGYLGAMGARVVLTRSSRCRVTTHRSAEQELGARVAIANKVKADLFISIHHNDSNKPHVNYSCVFYDAKHAAKSAKLAKRVLSNISRDLQVPMLGVAQGDYRVLKGLNMPGLLIEASFMSNPEEDRRLGSYCWDVSSSSYYYGYNDREAYAIARGIAIYSMNEKHQMLAPPEVKDVSAAFNNPVKKSAPKKKRSKKKGRRR